MIYHDFLRVINTLGERIKKNYGSKMNQGESGSFLKIRKKDMPVNQIKSHCLFSKFLHDNLTDLLNFPS